MDSKYTMLSLKDFYMLSLHWCIIGGIYADAHGQGKAIDFPLKMKVYVWNSPKHFIVKVGKLIQAPTIPLEVVSLTINTKTCSKEYLPT